MEPVKCTVQTAIASGTPFIGYAMQTEQQLNLDHVVMQKAGIRIPIHRFKAATIQKAIQTVAENKNYKLQMERLREKMATLDGRKAAAEEIWKFIMAK